MADDSDHSVEEEIRMILHDLTDEERELLNRVVKAERQKIHMKTPQNIYQDLKKIIQNTIQ